MQRAATVAATKGHRNHAKDSSGGNRGKARWDVDQYLALGALVSSEEGSEESFLERH